MAALDVAAALVSGPAVAADGPVATVAEGDVVGHAHGDVRQDFQNQRLDWLESIAAPAR
jgi:hypothetical protein